MKIFFFCFSVSLAFFACKKKTTFDPSPRLVYSAGFETGDVTEWSDVNYNLNRPMSEQLEIVTSPVRQGTYAVKTIVHDGDEFLDTGGERCDFESGGLREEEGDEYWYAWSTYFPADWQAPGPSPDDWLLIADWHSTYDDVGQLIQLEVQADNSLKVLGLTGKVNGYTGFNGSGKAHYFSEEVTPDIELETWHDFIFHVKWTTSDEGQIEMWHKTEAQGAFDQVLKLSDIPTLQYKTFKSSYKAPYFILAHYRGAGNANTSTLYHDGFRQSTSKEFLVEDGLYQLD